MNVERSGGTSGVRNRQGAQPRGSSPSPLHGGGGEKQPTRCSSPLVSEPSLTQSVRNSRAFGNSHPLPQPSPREGRGRCAASSTFQIVLLFALLLLSDLSAHAENPATAFDQANKLYEQGKFEQAATAYEKLVPSESAAV